MEFLTDFADQAVILPVVLAVALMLTIFGWWRGALVWLAAVGVTFGAVLGLKLGFLACGPVFVPWLLRSPSGHVAAAAVVAGGLAALLTGRRRVAILAAILAAGVIGYSRVALGFHSVPEVVLGGILGTAGAVALLGLTRRTTAGLPVPVAVAAVAVAIGLHGVHLPAEAAIWRVSQGGLDFLPACRDVGGGPV